MEIRYSPKFHKQYHKASGKIQSVVRQKIQLFDQNPIHPLLRNHKLKGKLLGYNSINITGDWRALFTENVEAGKLKIVFTALGTHSQLYK